LGENKKYYWLKLKEDFFRDKEIKKLRRIAGGDTYTIIYLKLQLLSLKREGKLIFENLEDSFAEEMALELDESTENVKMTLLYLQKCGLIEEVAENEYMLPQTVKCIGNETQVAERVRKHRENKKMLQCNTLPLLSNTCVTNSNTEIEKEKEIEKDIYIKPKKEVPVKNNYAEFVNMTETEYNKLITEHGEDITRKMITTLDNYKGSNNKKYANDYRAILSWVVEKVITNSKTEKKSQYKIV
jgi:predicted phage replisome organizer